MKVGYALAMAVAIGGQVLYHLMQKSLSASAHPVLSLMAFYAVAALLSLPLFLLFPLQQSLRESVGQLNASVWGVALAIVLIELGFLLAYRAGASLNSAFVLTASVVTASLLVMGWLLFQERLSLTQLAGLALCLSGIALMSRSAA
ncbi:EamA family transporter [Inhella gelatinilytica]|uniref:EamA family transporter n=1 Tax=Inhella gelatinilytica TaxID=2795030 RepID=A0A931IXY9_9BURK|nr:EamA family transporter [Inhella gelatinilytica]MBH9552673.1 EamA family transporter [Inhella gelatinilytica]